MSAECVEIILSGSDVPEDRRDSLLESINKIISTNWQSTEPFWSRQHSPFEHDYGLVFLRKHSLIVGYFIYKRLSLDGVPTFYGAGTAVLRSEHGLGGYPLMLRKALATECSSLAPDVSDVYFAWRMRNPAIWVACARMCRVVAPALIEEKKSARLEEACTRIAQEVFPVSPIEFPTMIMRGVFPHLTELEANNHPRNSIGKYFARALANPSDAIFSVGIVEKSKVLGTVRSSRFQS